MPLPQISFAQGDAKALEAKLKSFYEEVRRASGEPAYSLAAGDPTKLIQQSEAALLAQVNTYIDATGKGNLLYYAGEETIEHIGRLYGERGARLQPAAAATTIRYTLSALRNVATTIPAGNRTTPDNKVFFATTEPLEISAGSLHGEACAECMTDGTVGNGFEVGEIKNIVDRVPFAQSAINVTESAGGADLEPLEAYRARIHLLPESLSTAGPDGAYIFWAMTANADIIDVAVYSPSPVEVNVIPLMRGGEMPPREVLDAVFAVLDDRKRRPLTDKVNVLPPLKREYKIEARYWIFEHDSANSVSIQTNAEAAIGDYINWQCGKLGRDINPSMLHKFIMSAGVKRVEIALPVFTKLEQDEVAVLTGNNATYEGLENG